MTEPVCFRDQGDWPEALMCLVLGAVSLPLVGWLWTLPASDVPRVFLVPFTAVFLISLPFLVRSVSGARTRTLSVDTATGAMTLEHRRMFAKTTETFTAIEAAQIVHDVRDDDGVWTKSVLHLVGGREVIFAQGGSPEETRSAADRLAAALGLFRTEVPVVEDHRT